VLLAVLEEEEEEAAAAAAEEAGFLETRVGFARRHLEDEEEKGLIFRAHENVMSGG
jgi:hypothetical protein